MRISQCEICSVSWAAFGWATMPDPEPLKAHVELFTCAKLHKVLATEFVDPVQCAQCTLVVLRISIGDPMDPLGRRVGQKLFGKNL